MRGAFQIASLLYTRPAVQALQQPLVGEHCAAGHVQRAHLATVLHVWKAGYGEAEG